MHDIWNPWHGCIKFSEDCQNCYMYFLDKMRGESGARIYKVKNNFYYPLSKNRQGEYKIKSGEMLRVCMTSDFFLEQADIWREEAWHIMRARSDVIFLLITKRIHRVKDCLPGNWGNGWDNIFLTVTCENQKRADERIPQLLNLPFKHKGIICAPFIGRVSIKKYLETGQIEQVICGGENYNGARPCYYEWVKSLRQECVDTNTTFCFMETGTLFIKDGRAYNLSSKKLQSEMAYKSGMNYEGRQIDFKLYDQFGRMIAKEKLYKRQFKKRCKLCASQIICNGCSNCENCK